MDSVFAFVLYGIFDFALLKRGISNHAIQERLRLRLRNLV